MTPGNKMTNSKFLTIFRDHLHTQEKTMSDLKDCHKATSDAVQNISEVLVALKGKVDENNTTNNKFKNKLILGLVIVLAVLAVGKEVVAFAWGLV